MKYIIGGCVAVIAISVAAIAAAFVAAVVISGVAVAGVIVGGRKAYAIGAQHYGWQPLKQRQLGPAPWHRGRP